MNLGSTLVGTLGRGRQSGSTRTIDRETATVAQKVQNETCIVVAMLTQRSTLNAHGSDSACSDSAQGPETRRREIEFLSCRRE